MAKTPKDDAKAQAAMEAKKRGLVLLWMLLASNDQIENAPEDETFDVADFHAKQAAYNEQANVFLQASLGREKIAAAAALAPLQDAYALAIYKGLTVKSGPIAGITDNDAVQLVKEAIDVVPSPIHDVASKRAALAQTQAIFHDVAVNSTNWPGSGGHPAASELTSLFPLTDV